MVVIREEKDVDLVAIDEVNRLAFEGEDEVQIVQGLRVGAFVTLSLVAEVDGMVVGHCMFSRMHIGETEAIALAPVAVLPEFQRQGIGKQLIKEGLDRSREQAHQRVIVLGHAEYYPKFGFNPELAVNIEHPYPPKNYMALELVPGAMAGIKGKAIYPPPLV